MSERAEMRGPAPRRRRTTIGGGVKQANGSRWHEQGEKPPRCPAKARTDEALRGAGNNGDLSSEMSGQQQKSAVEDIHDRLR